MLSKGWKLFPFKSVDHQISTNMLKDIIFNRLIILRYLIKDGGSYFLHGDFREVSVKYDVNHRVAILATQNPMYKLNLGTRRST